MTELSLLVCFQFIKVICDFTHLKKSSFAFHLTKRLTREVVVHFSNKYFVFNCFKPVFFHKKKIALA